MKNIITFILLMLITSIGYPQFKGKDATVRFHYEKSGKTIEVKTKNLDSLLSTLNKDIYFGKKISKNMDLKKIEKEFTRIYLDYQDSVFKEKKEYGEFLDSLSYCQLNYLSKRDFISHEQNNIKLKTVTSRLHYFYNRRANTCGEILVMLSLGNDEIDIAGRMFRLFLLSPSHKKIIDDKVLKYYNFKFKYNINGYIIGIGVFSSTIFEFKN